MECDSAPSELLAVGNINAPVNSEKALSKTYPLLKRIAYPIAKLDRSVCVGIWRLTFSVEYGKEGPTVYYSQHKEVIQNPNRPQHARMYTSVTSPVTMPYPFASPVKVPVSSTTGGHEGKTTLAKNLMMLLAGAVMWSNDDLVGHKSKWPSADLVMKMCEKRVLTCDECEIEDGFSYQHVKRWTSNGPRLARRQNGLLVADLDSGLQQDPVLREDRRQQQHREEARDIWHEEGPGLGEARRVVDRSEITNSAILKFLFLFLCLACGNAYWSTPTSPAIVMYTMFRKSINGITAGIGYDVTSNREQSTVATAMVAVRCRVKPTILCNAMKAISSEMIMTRRTGCPTSGT
ncbi:hypothetical protein DL770_005042 [Monosporascus sp. CRB-9-2]|nr:hypothetical protein DL770_005042 [Monosporascus sp. CRB-9-2]